MHILYAQFGGNDKESSENGVEDVWYVIKRTEWQHCGPVKLRR